MNLYQKKFDRIKNIKGFTLKKDFSFGSLSYLTLTLFMALGAWAQLLVFPNFPLEGIILLSTFVMVTSRSSWSYPCGLL